MRLTLTPIVEQLRTGFRQVEGVLEFSRQDTPPRTLPALFVVPASEAAQANKLAGARDQVVDVGFAVMLVVDGARRNAAGIAEDLSIEGEKVKALLTGWRHPQASRACDFVRASLASASGSIVVWDMRFTARYHIRQPS